MRQQLERIKRAEKIPRSRGEQADKGRCFNEAS